jgi:two-component system, OmpR family, response regulator
MERSPHILVVDDNREIRDLLSRLLGKEGLRVSTAGDGKAMRRVLTESRIDLIVLDLMLPGEDGLALCRRLRADSQIPVIMLTAKGDEIDRVVGLEMGADDYLAKPFSTRELIARIRAVLRRAATPGSQESGPLTGRFTFDSWTLDAARRELISGDGVVVPLSTGEFDLLSVFVQHPQTVLNRDQLLDLARGRAATAFDRSIDTQVSRLRRKIEIDAKDPRIIKTVWGGGYVFTSDVAASSAGPRTGSG